MKPTTPPNVWCSKWWDHVSTWSEIVCGWEWNCHVISCSTLLLARMDSAVHSIIFHRWIPKRCISAFVIAQESPWIHSSDICFSSTDEDYIEDSIKIPYRVSGAGPSAGLDVVIDIAKDDYVSYSQAFYGVSIYVHSFNEFPQIADKMVIAQPSTDVLIAVEPTVLTSAGNIRPLPLRLRNCYFEDEAWVRICSRFYIILWVCLKTENT